MRTFLNSPYSIIYNNIYPIPYLKIFLYFKQNVSHVFIKYVCCIMSIFNCCLKDRKDTEAI